MQSIDGSDVDHHYLNTVWSRSSVPKILTCNPFEDLHLRVPLEGAEAAAGVTIGG